MTSQQVAWRRATRSRVRTRRRLSVCTMASGRSPERLVAALSLLRAVADEIVVALDDRRPDAADTLATIADRVLLFPHAEPVDRPLAWLFGRCRGDWILNIDDDEIPGPALVRALPQLIGDRDITHCWIARRWLFPGPTSFLDEPPWASDYQLRLVQADERFLRFTDEFHVPVSCTGPMRFVDAPLWHLDTALSTFEERRAKALRYEHARRGMRVGAYSHNTGLFLPELRADAVVVPVPPADLRSIRRVLTAKAAEGVPRARLARVLREEVDAAWPGPPVEPSFYDARITIPGERLGPIVAGAQGTIDVRIENLGTATWRVGSVAIGTRWEPGGEGIRTQLPADVRGGATTVVPLHVLAPAPGVGRLEIDLVHEHVRWFDTPLQLEVRVLPRRRVLVVGVEPDLDRALDAIALEPEVEPVVVVMPLPGRPPHEHPTVDDPAARLFGPAGRDTVRAIGRGIALCARARLRRPGGDGFLTSLADAEALVVAGSGIDAARPPTRERLRLLAIELTARAAGVTVLLARDARPPAGGSRRDPALDGLARRLGEPTALLDVLDDHAGGGTRTPTPFGRRF